ncbi:uncharacterized protein LOC134811780 [Bolinopsis microptera]|uniref:uncharacterized protein LOC134811780 n=1 Tax=Bolinopsis microptera TaxID=2820187 RepID=UPI003079F85E
MMETAADSTSNEDNGYMNRVFIGSLRKSIMEEHVRGFLKSKGYNVEDVKIIRDVNGQSKGYGFVDLDRSARGELQANHLLNQYRMWYDINIKEGFFVVFKSAYRKTKAHPVQVVKEISTNEIFQESFTIYQTDEAKDELHQNVPSVGIQKKPPQTPPTLQPVPHYLNPMYYQQYQYHLSEYYQFEQPVFCMYNYNRNAGA